MLRLSETHLLGDDGPLCGTRPPYCWSPDESEATCEACRAVLEGRDPELQPSPAQAAVPIGRLRPRER